jgi:hypothetical protein
VSALELSKDRKVASGGYYQASRKRWIPAIKNSFGLPSGDSCPGRTEFCTSCYAERSERQPGVRSLVERNLDRLRSAGTVAAMAHLLVDAVGEYAEAARRHQVPMEDRIFRIHWDGDFFSTDYARAWRKAILAHPGIQFWAYTRSFTAEVNVVPHLVGLANLELYLSVDEHNAARAALVSDIWPAVKLALCAPTEDDARALMPGRSVACPENVGRVPLMTDGRGACLTCRLCPDGIVNIRFLTKRGGNHHVGRRSPVRLASPSVSLIATDGTCGSPECGEPVRERSGDRGRRPKFCSEMCRHRAAYLRRTAA